MLTYVISCDDVHVILHRSRRFDMIIDKILLMIIQYLNKNTFLYNPKKSKNNYDVYSNNNPSDTIPIKYTTIDDVKNTIIKLEKLYKTDKYPHKRISQVAMIMKVRLEIFKKNKNKYKNLKHINERFNLAKKYFDFLKLRTTKKLLEERKNMIFNF